MRSRGRRITAGIVWVLASLFMWAGVVNATAVLLMYLASERQAKFPDWAFDVFSGTTVAGAVLIPGFVALLAMRSKLPWTSDGSPKGRGFPIESSRPPDDSE
jgi:hypothetical protein